MKNTVLKQIQELSNRIDSYCEDMGESGMSISELRFRVSQLQHERSILIQELEPCVK